MKIMSDLPLQNQRVLVREDFNVPMNDQGEIINDQRLQAALPTIQTLLTHNAAIILLSHLGRPTEGVFEQKYSLRPVADYLSKILQKKVRFELNYLEGLEIQPGEIILCENVRFNLGEKKNDPVLAQKMAKLGDFFIMDAFATAHRAEASTCGIAHYLSSAAGPLLEREIKALKQVMDHPEKPLTAIVGGAKVSDKLVLLEHLVKKVKVNTLIVGGGIANTFLAALGKPVGQSLYEPALLNEAQHIMQVAQDCGCFFPLPEDVVVAETLSEHVVTQIKNIDSVCDQDRIFDIGPQTIRHLTEIIQTSKTLLWNDPVGVFEYAPFAAGTKAIASAIANTPESFHQYSVAGGGDTLSAVEQFNITQHISYLSTGGGAFLEYIQGKKLPAILAL